jgi:hypothetical protein
VESDKIHLLYQEAEIGALLDENEKIIETPVLVQLSIRMDIEKVTQVELSDVSSDEICNYGDIPSSPSKIASFTSDPKANIKKIDFRIRLPCAAYRQKFYYLIKVKSLEGNYFIRKRFPGKVIWNAGSGA